MRLLWPCSSWSTARLQEIATIDRVNRHAGAHQVGDLLVKMSIPVSRLSARR
jgi:hypothetical protein